MTVVSDRATQSIENLARSARAAGLERAPGGMAPVEVRGDVHRRRRSHAEGALRVVADGPHRVPVRAVRR